jgi:hypothetical protein
MGGGGEPSRGALISVHRCCNKTKVPVTAGDAMDVPL